MSNADSTVWITYNGEIYNSGELRLELQQLGYAFCSTSDTEVILHGYEAWGEGVVLRLRGMFAFAIVHLEAVTSRVRRLVLARDHLGIKPLYYALDHGRLVFASELKALHAARLIGREIDPVALASYLMLGAVPNPLTIYREARSLPPATLLTWQNGHIGLRTYWRMPTDTVATPTDEKAVETVRQLVYEAVRIHLVSDVPLGAFLSGGLDSSAIVALMRAATSGTIRTCSMVFAEAAYDEGPYARAMADAIGAEHYERLITSDDLRREFEAVLSALDQPSVDGVNTYFVSQTARQAGLTVALSGVGSDELFGGYPNTFQGVPQMLKAVHWAQRVPGGTAVARVGLERLTRRRQWRRVSDALQRPATAASAYVVRRGLFAPQEVAAMLHDDLRSAAAFDVVQHIADRADGAAEKMAHDGRASISWISRAELSTYMHHQLLRDTDVMSMAHSLEVRVPFVDQFLVETVLRLPERLLQSGSGPKPLLRRVVNDSLPDLIRQRDDKRGFTFPFDRWLREAACPQIQDVLGQVKSRGWLKPEAIDQTWREYEAGHAHWSRVWALVALKSIV